MRIPKIFMVTGLSGSGKTLALKALEDLGCEVVDNMPVSLCTLLVKEKGSSRPLALGIDLRTRDFSPESLKKCMEQLRKESPTAVLFLEAQSSVIAARYRETRRSHPLGLEKDVETLIHQESQLLAQVRQEADVVFDTSGHSPPEMRCALQSVLGLKAPELVIYLLSFSFRLGIPKRSDFLFDMRFLSNPHYEKDIKFLTGQTQQIQDYLQKESRFRQFLESCQTLFSSCVFPRLKEEGRGSVILSFGCTGGRHRSVGTAETLGRIFLNESWNVRTHHRDL